MKALLTNDAEGNEITLEIKDYVKFLVKELNVKDVVSEAHGTTSAHDSVEYVVETLVVKKKELDPEVENLLSEVVERVKSDLQNTQQNCESEKEKAAKEKADKEAAKAAEKLKKEEDAKAAAATQLSFNTQVNAGFDQAVAEFAKDVDSLKEGLPDGVSLAHSGTGWGVILAEGSSKEVVGQSLGYLMGKSEGNKWLANQLQFLAGDLTNAAVKQGVYSDMKSAAKSISEYLKSNSKILSPASIEVYSRLSSRTLPELRNPQVDTTAYLELSRIKKPKAQDKETPEAFKLRQTKLEDGIRAIQESLSKGEIRNRKDVLPKILELEYETGLKDRPDPNAAPTITVGTYLKNYFLASIGIEKLDGINTEKGTVIYLDEDGKNKHVVQVADLEELKTEAEMNLLNIFFETKKVSAKDYMRGFITEEKEEAIGTKPDGTAITEKKTVKTPVYTTVFFPITKEEPEAPDEGGDQAPEVKGETPAAEEDPAPKKKTAKK